MQEKTIFSQSLEETFQIGKDFSREISQDSIISLIGELGTGKTLFIQGIMTGLGYQEIVNSPTFSLVNEYHLPQFSLFHFDLYRIKSKSELLRIGWDDFIERGACFIEWGNLFPELLPKKHIEIHFSTISIHNRFIHIKYNF